MARKPPNGSLEQAITLLIQNEAAFLGRLSAMDERIAAADERIAAANERMTAMDKRIAGELAEIKNVLLRHEQLLQALPEAIRQKIGFESR